MRGTQSRPQISHSDARVDEGGGGGVVTDVRYEVTTGARKVDRSECGGERMPYAVRESAREGS